jgi:hypothetical protein
MLGGLECLWELANQLRSNNKPGEIHGWPMTLATCESCDTVLWLNEKKKWTSWKQLQQRISFGHSLRESHPRTKSFWCSRDYSFCWSKVTFGYVDCTLRLYSTTDCDWTETFLNRATSVLWRSTTQCRSRQFEATMSYAGTYLSLSEGRNWWTIWQLQKGQREFYYWYWQRRRNAQNVKEIRQEARQHGIWEVRDSHDWRVWYLYLIPRKAPKGWWESTVFVYAHQSHTWLYKNP